MAILAIALSWLAIVLVTWAGFELAAIVKLACRTLVALTRRQYRRR